ncbi:hypothetical protein N183_33735 [Sinorhizobium sp. Sb3]|nr:hypothetical protein N183_33735 [Sinorhizobium sp. Sb3]
MTACFMRSCTFMNLAMELLADSAGFDPLAFLREAA